MNSHTVKRLWLYVMKAWVIPKPSEAAANLTKGFILSSITKTGCSDPYPIFFMSIKLNG